MAVGVFAQDLPRIAVYVTGDIGDNEKKALGTQMLSSLVNSGRYRGIERSNAFLAEVEKEHIKQRSGAIDDGQISELGKQFGVRFVCVADITPAFGAYSVSARIINVETAEVPFIGNASSPLKTMDDLEQVSVEVIRKMLYFAGESGGATKQEQQKPKQEKMAAGSARKKIEKQRMETKYDASMDFTTGERWGTWVLNVVPGLGSTVIMKDYKGAIINAAIGGGGIIMAGIAGSIISVDGHWVIGTIRKPGEEWVIRDYDTRTSLAGTAFAIWIGCGSAWNIYRSTTYHHPDAIKKSATTPLQALNAAVLPDENGNIKGYLLYSMEF
jgi:hypothetical protein